MWRGSPVSRQRSLLQQSPSRHVGKYITIFYCADPQASPLLYADDIIIIISYVGIIVIAAADAVVRFVYYLIFLYTLYIGIFFFSTRVSFYFGRDMIISRTRTRPSS